MKVFRLSYIYLGNSNSNGNGNGNGNGNIKSYNILVYLGNRILETWVHDHNTAWY